MDDTGPSKRGFTPIGQVLEGLLEECRSNSAGGIVHLLRVWQRVVGPPIADNAKPFAVNGRLLLVHVSSSAWLHQLHFLKADLLKRLNLALREKQQLRDIKFKIGSI